MRVARICGIEFRVNPFLVLLLLVYSSAGLVRETLVAFWIVVLHELAHIAVASCFGFRAERVEFLPFGGVAVFSEPLALQPAAEAITAAAGPVHNFAFAVFAAVLQRNGHIAPNFARFLVETNLAIGIFNLLPAIPLDGGRILRAVLAPRIGLARATALAVRVGRLAGATVLVAGSILAYLGRCNVLVPALGGFLVFAATKEARQVPYDRIRDSLRKKRRFLETGAISTQLLAVQEATLFRDVVRRLEPGKLNVVLVFSRDLELLGITTEIDVLEAMVKHGPDAPVRVLVI